jgi:hypothetical protein
MKIAVIDYECLTSAGLSLSDTWNNLVRNRSGIDFINRYQPRQTALHWARKVEYGATTIDL